MLYLSCSSAKIADSRAIQLQESMSNRIEGAVGEAEGLCVANFEFHGKPMISAPPDCLGDQQFAEVHACVTSWLGGMSIFGLRYPKLPV